MVAGCGINCIKCILFVINFLFFVMGAVGIGVGIWALVDKNNLSDLTSLDVSGGIDYYNAVGLLKSAAIALVVGGAFLFITGFAGCCGAVKEVKCLLGVYIAIVLLVLVAEVVAAGLAIVFKSSIPGKLKIKLYETLQHEYDGLFNSSNPFTRAFDAVQIQFECCGIFNASDFFSSNWFSGGTGNVPVTCCKMTNPDRYFSDGIATLVNRKCTTDPFGPSNPYTNKPCYQALEDWVMKHVNIIIGISFGIAGVEIFAIIFACCLYRAIED